MAPVFSPVLTSPVNGGPSRQLSSTGSVQSVGDRLGASASSSSVRLPAGSVEPVKAEGLRHARIKLEARHYKKVEFAAQFLKVVRALQLVSWTDERIKPEDVIIRKVSGALTNAVFFASCKAPLKARTLLLRIYGPSSGSLISRPRELHILHKLSSIYHIGPRVYGTFENGRIEEFFESTTLTAGDIREPSISRWIGARMAEFHSVDIAVVSPPSDVAQNGWEIGVKKCVSSWIAPAHDVLSLPAIGYDVRHELDLSRFEKEWKIYMLWIKKAEDKHSGSAVVFAHNDTQYGNLLRMNNTTEATDDHRQLIVVDFEYASPNPAAYDIANHFHEWTANYHGATPHILDRSRYPSFEQRRNFYTAYIHHSTMFGEDAVFENSHLDQLVAALDYQVRVWSPASHAMWAIWGIIQARDDVENNVLDPEFNYIDYARGRMAAFRQEILELGVIQR